MHCQWSKASLVKTGRTLAAEVLKIWVPAKFLTFLAPKIIHSKSWIRWSPDSEDNFEFPAERMSENAKTQKLTILHCVTIKIKRCWKGLQKSPKSLINMFLVSVLFTFRIYAKNPAVSTHTQPSFFHHFHLGSGLWANMGFCCCCGVLWQPEILGRNRIWTRSSIWMGI